MPAECAICRKPLPPRRGNPSHPFCSPRCRQVDLGRWLGEEYRVPTRATELEEDGVPERPPPDDSHAE